MITFLEFIKQDEFGSDNESGKRELVVLVGPPAIGKSTYIKKKFPPGECIVINRDDIVNDVASSLGITYDEMFINPPADSVVGDVDEKYGVVELAPAWMKWAKFIYSKLAKANQEVNDTLKNRLASAIASDKSVIIDMTNMTIGSRRSVLEAAKGRDMFRRAVVFTMAESDLPELIKRNKTRSEEIKASGGSKSIGSDVIDRMVKSFQEISPREGFDRVDTVASFAL